EAAGQNLVRDIARRKKSCRVGRRRCPAAKPCGADSKTLALTSSGRVKARRVLRGPQRGLPEAAQARAWQSRWNLRGHLDATRCMVLDDSNLILVTSGEDVLVKCWDLRSIWRVDNTLDMEPFNVFRGHSAAVLALTFRPQD
ncbi:unnamed protein product, partial [Effrenium voratum]